MDILLTFAGNRDPFNPEFIQGANSDGPVLALLGERFFNRIYIFTTPTTLSHAQDLKIEITKRLSAIKTSILNIYIPDPTDYEALFLHMNRHCQNIINEHKKDQPSPSFLKGRQGGFPNT